MEQNIETSSSPAIPADDVLFIALELGEHILLCGGEINRAEDTIRRICKAYGATHVDVTVIWSMIALTVDFNDKRSTCTRRITSSTATNLDKLSRLNNLSRTICTALPEKAEVKKRMADIAESSRIKKLKFIIGSIIGAFGFAVFFSDFSNGVTPEILLWALADALAAGIIALPMCLVADLLSKTKTNPIITKVIVCFLGGMAAMLFGRAVPFLHADKIMIGNIMNYIPGVGMTNAFRDLFGGDTMSGLFRLCTVLIDAVAIAAGYAVAILIFGGAI